jgi:hypothetical protein
MMKRMIRYKIKADQVAENERLVLGVYDELKRLRPAGLRYATLRLDDGASFVHLVSYDEGANAETLTSLPSFKAFVAGIRQRCEEAPVTSDLTAIGAYGFFDDGR